MRVSCPACDAAYEIPETVLGGGRSLRCARCAHEWAPLPAARPADQEAEEETAPPDAPLPIRDAPPEAPMTAPRDGDEAELSPPVTIDPVTRNPVTRPPPRLVASPPLIQDRPEPDEPRRGIAATAAAWGVSILALAALAGAAYVFRDAVQSAWPPSQVLYAALGLG